MVWYSHVFKNFPELVVIHTVKGFGIVNKAEVNVFLELSCLFNDPMDVGNLILKARILKWFGIPFSSGPHFVRTLHDDPSVLGGPTWRSFIELDMTMVHGISLVSFL